MLRRPFLYNDSRQEYTYQGDNGVTKSVVFSRVYPIRVNGVFYKEYMSNDELKDYDWSLREKGRMLYHEAQNPDKVVYYCFEELGVDYVANPNMGEAQFLSVYVRRAHEFCKKFVSLNGNIVTIEEWKAREEDTSPLNVENQPLFVTDMYKGILEHNTLELALAWDAYAHKLLADGYLSAFCEANKKVEAFVEVAKCSKLVGCHADYFKIYCDYLQKVNLCFTLQYPYKPRHQIVEIHSKNSCWLDGVEQMKLKKIEMIGDDAWKF